MNNFEEKIFIGNNTIIKRELEDILKLNMSIIKSSSSEILMLGLINYTSFINLEVMNYISNNFNTDLRQFLKFKNIIINIRARLKEENISFKERSIKIAQFNKETYEEFKKTNIISDILNISVENLGIYYKDKKIIGNTFLYDKNYKYLKTDGSYGKEKIIDYGNEQGQLVAEFSKIFKVSTGEKIDTKKIDIVCKDFDVFSLKTKIFNDNIDRTICLKILDMISNINYYFMIIANILENNSTLRYRIAYIIWYTAYNDLSKIIDVNSSFDKPLEEKKFSDILNNQKIYLNQDFRNCMFHYDIKHVITKEYYDENKLFLGLVEQIFNFSELEYIITIEVFLKRLLKLFEETILKYCN